jgi:hypothetical protein
VSQDLVRKHYRELWGEPSRVAEHIFRRQAFQIWKWDADRTAEGVALYATIGASAHPICRLAKHRDADLPGHTAA